MSSIDKRIVQMQFDNQGFERGVNTTMKSLKNLNESLKMKNATNGLTEVQSGINKLTSLGMGALSSGVDAVSTKFNALNVIAATALMNITNRAIEAGMNLSRKLTIEPITTGFNEYETKMGAIQTILTNTASKGTTMDDVTAALNELNTYADKTIYSFSEMTKNIGTFTAAGVDLEDSVQAIKGIANLGAGSGSDPVQVATGMYQLSQALAAGKVGLQDWNSVVNAGMGGELFKNELITMAKSMGIYVDESKPFRETLQDGWLTSEVLLKTLQKFAEDESLVKAATEVKTLTGLIGTMQESVQSGWAVSWEHIFGNKEQAAELFTAISDGFTKIIAPSTNARNAMLKFWNEHGGRSAIIEGLTNVVESFGKVLRGIGMAWEMVFPPMTGQKLVDLSNKFKDLTEKFKITDQTAGKIGAVFKGFLDTVILVKDGVVSLVDGLFPLKDLFKGVGSSILDLTSKFGKFLSGLRESASNMGFFEGISSYVENVSVYIADFITSMSNGIMSALGKIMNLDFSSFFKAIAGGFSGIVEFLKPIVDSIVKVIGTIDFNTFFKLIEAGSAVAMFKSIKEMMNELGGVTKVSKGFIESFKETFTIVGDVGKSISETLDSVRETLEEYQKNLQASTLMKIAGAIAILAASLLLISSIDAENLITGLSGIGILFGELVAALILIVKFTDGKGMMALATVGGTMRNIAIGVGILALALKEIGKMNAQELSSGILGLTIAMGLMVASARLLSGNMKGMVVGSTGLIIFGVALHVMASALEELGSIDTEVMGAGLGSLAILLAELALFMVAAKFGNLGPMSAAGILILSLALNELQKAVEGFGSMNPDAIIKGLAGVAAVLTEIALFSAFGGGGFNLIGLGTGLVIISNAMVTLANAVTSFGNMKWEELAKGLTAMAGGLVVFGVASALLSGPQMIAASIGIAAMSVSMLLLSTALKSMGSMSWEEIGKGLLVLAGSLTILAVAMYAMSGCLLGAAAIVVMAGALAILTPQILILSQMSLPAVGIALLALAGAFTVLGLAGLLLTPVIPTLIALAGVVALLGVGLAAAGAGVSLFGVGLGLIGVAVAGSGILIVEFLNQLINLLPKLGTKLGEMIVNLAGALGDGLTEIVSAIETILTALLTAIGNVIPQIVDVAVDIVIAFAEGLARGIPAVVNCGLEMILGVLEGLASNMQAIVEAGADAVIGFLDGMASKLPDIIESAMNLAISFVQGLADSIDANHERMREAGTALIEALVNAAVDFCTMGAVPDFIGMGKDLMNGLIDGAKSLWANVCDAVTGAIDSAKTAASNLGTALVQAGKDLIQGFMNGIKSKAQDVWDAAVDVANNAKEAVLSFLGINSPSRVFMEIGKYTVEGMAVGLDKYAYMAERSATDMANGVLNNVKNPLSNVSKLLNDKIDVNPRITPVLDLTNVENGTRLLSDMLDNQDIGINARSGMMMAGTMGQIQNRTDNSDIVSALKDLKDGLNNSTSYTINGITYDDGSNITNAVETLVRAARIERRI